MYATGQFPALAVAGLPTEGLQFALLMYALISVVFIGLSLRMNVALTFLFTVISAAYFCLGIGQTHDMERATKVTVQSLFVYGNGSGAHYRCKNAAVLWLLALGCHVCTCRCTVRFTSVD